MGGDVSGACIDDRRWEREREKEGKGRGHGHAREVGSDSSSNNIVRHPVQLVATRIPTPVNQR